LAKHRKPLIGITCCTREDDEAHVHFLSDAYVQVVLSGMGGLPVPVPAYAGDLSPDEILEGLDGLIVTGSRSNVRPELYGGPTPPEDEPSDIRRDATTLPLIRRAVALGVPVLGVCRGHQEFNVAFGGTLFTRVHEQPGYADHRDPHGPAEVMFAPAHPVSLTAGGVLRGLLGADEVTVNSLHWQGVDKVGPGLLVDARAPDGLVEALTVPGAGAFALSVQWHPEWRFAENPHSRAIFAALGEAAAKRALST